MESAEHHEKVLAISRIVDEVADEYLDGEPDWDPLHAVLPTEWCDGFMWMFRTEQGDAVIEHFKHGITRQYLNLDQANRAYRYTGNDYVQIPVVEAVDLVFDGIEEMGWTRETRYDEEFVAAKHRLFRDAGFTVISTASPSSAELLREFEGPQASSVSDEL